MAETTSRILTLLNLLQTHRQWGGGDLAERLGVTERTLRRDIERLRELGYRVEATRGAAGGYRLEAGSQLPPLLLTDDEAVTMAIGLRVAATQGLADGEQTTLSALAKFEQVLSAALRQRVNAVAGFVQPQSPRFSDAPVSQELLGQLALACRDRERIRFHYVAAGGVDSDRVVEPHTLVAAARRWFFVCWDLQRDDWRTFRVDRMSSFFGTRVHFDQRDLPAEDAAAFVASALTALRRRVSADAHLRMPLRVMREQFGPWSTDAEAIDEEWTRWPISGDSLETMLSSLAWIPVGVEYTLHGPPEFLAFAAEAAERMRRAVPANSPFDRLAD
ncbi:WYL domain-containing protein [Herbiconiux sp. CPCC 205763]|uniref:WYL domain-containing protein n=1 Tax=Herbiconiux aconitum TaxID=2970913 RepID=A0ABT2GKC0_9MICO|nr:WYL domain-containing protein [Herbiconiux aconitum]MCS5716667.1 WYL domain-containing protein [Herbiconiux aconitum]